MRALTVLPGESDSAEVLDVPEPAVENGDVLVATQLVGICGTDREILRGDYGEAPPGRKRLVLGHEIVGRVLETPANGALRAGDWVAGMVRLPDPVPCANGAAGEWDMCRNGRYTEHGIKGLDGFASERFRLPSGHAVPVPPELGELGVLVTGAGSIGLLAALFGRQRGLNVHVLDRATDGPTPGLARALGATYHSDGLTDLCRESDAVLEFTGAPQVIVDAIAAARPNGIVCLAGLGGGRPIRFDVAAMNRDLVLENNVVFGTVNANRRHYEQAALALARADRAWLARLVTRRVPYNHWREALRKEAGDVKTVLAF